MDPVDSLTYKVRFNIALLLTDGKFDSVKWQKWSNEIKNDDLLKEIPCRMHDGIVFATNDKNIYEKLLTYPNTSPFYGTTLQKLCVDDVATTEQPPISVNISEDAIDKYM